MKVACYCQHVLGIGHFHRSLELCKALAENHETVMILGGPDVTLPETKVRFLQLPGLKMDENFSRLIPCREPEKGNLEAVKDGRRQQLYDFFSSFEPDIFLVELYPFGRKAFRFELDPILKGIDSGELAPCIRLCSLRDILVEKKDKQKYETRVLTVLNTLFDGLLIHSDPDFIPLEKTFSQTGSIAIPYRYTGFITPPPGSTGKGTAIRRKLGLSEHDKLLIASIGGGNVGSELLRATAEAAVILKDETNIHFHLFTGKYSDVKLLEELRQTPGNQLVVHNFCSDFTDWLEAADLSISMAGYNTCMNLLAAGTPALLYPFAQNREQRMRISAFSTTSPFGLLEKEDLDPIRFAERITAHLQLDRQPGKADLNGAATSSELCCTAEIWNRQS
ncbi:MAG TPA: glycosyl transferase [Desulfocapsa sulfexigens]|nr:glycosyl transferase [Desulfocapsa sulfexigens]